MTIVRRSLPLFLVLLVAPLVLGQVDPVGGGGFTPPQISIEGSVVKRSGEAVEGVVVATIPETWHINSARPLDDFAIPTVLTLDPATAVLSGVQYPPHETKTFSFSAGNPIAVYEGTVRIPFTARLASGSGSVKATLKYQACNNSVCLPPKSVSTEFSATPGAAASSAGTAAGSPVTAAPPASKSGSQFTPLSQAPPRDRLATAFATSGLPLTLAILFVLGMALNLTPCVLPMVPITMSFFAMQSDGRRSRRFTLSLLYVLGLVVTYSALGVFAALSGAMFGSWLQQPAVLIGLALLMLVLASSMFGAFDIGVPQFIATRAAGRAGLAGAMTMGLFVGIVAAPCVGPVVVSLIALVASIGKPLIGLAMFATLAFGLGFPYLVMLNIMPRPGEWMVHIKKAMGFILVAMAFYFLRPLIGEAGFQYGVAASLLVGAAFLLIVSARGSQARGLRIASGIVLLVSGVAFAMPRGEASKSLVTWEKYDAARLAGAGQPVVIDFFADWCLPCKELDSRTFSDPAVAEELKRFRRVKADLTLPDDPKTEALTRQYAIVGVPTIVFIGSNGEEIRALRLTGFEPPGKFLERARQAR
jgi:thiol:disulfide interchange protein DsbD